MHSVIYVEVSGVATDLGELLGEVASEDLVAISIAIANEIGVIGGGLPVVILFLFLVVGGLSIPCLTSDI